MASLSSGINVALRAVLSQTQVMEVIEHNVANANTEGYHKQSAVLRAVSMSPSTATYYNYGSGQLGAGVTVSQVQRFTQSFYDTKYRSVASENSSWSYQSSELTRIEADFGDLSNTGLSTALDEFWTSWQDLAADPTNSSLRTMVLSDASALTNKFNSNSQSLVALQQDQNTALKDRADEVNSLAKTVADLNYQITQAYSVNQQPNDLLDSRDLALDRLAELAGAVSTTQDNGQVIVTINGHLLVSGQNTTELSTQTDPNDASINQIVWSDNGDTLSPQTGEIGGILKVRDEYIPGQLNALNQMAATLIDQVNTLHSSGYTQDGSDGGNFFSGTDATNISVLDTLTAKDLAISSSKTEVGNSDIAAKIYNLRSQKLMNGNSQSIGDYYNDKVTNLALITETAKTNKSQDSTVLDALDEQRQSVTGVSLDEEAANLTTTQKAYQAAARLMNTYDEMLDIVINQMGLVGRS